MKRRITKLLFISFLGILLSCESKTYIKQSIVLNLRDWSLPDTAKVSIPFDMKLSAQTANSCISKLDFVVESLDSISLRVYAQAIYENSGNVCDSIVVSKDTTIRGSFRRAGKFYFYFLKNNSWNKDTIVIIP